MDIGNMSLLCLVDSSNRRNFEMLHEILWSALNFFGMPYKVFDLAKNSLSLEELKAHSVVVIGQEHLGKSLSEDETKYIIDAVAEGIGLVVFDGDVHHYKDPLKETLGLKTTEEPTHMPHLTTDIIRILDNSHYITAGKELEFIRFNSPVQVGNVVSIETYI
ncbi:hypothetical protein KEJ25_03645 [Candidatus Bathyarchaeota archaeon]|nr:hypothetical protein [Candidatus Bathyarchaeota archaeon]